MNDTVLLCNDACSISYVLAHIPTCTGVRLNNQKRDNSGSLTREKFLLPEMRIVAGLVVDGVEDDDIVEKAFAENLFQFPTDRMSRDIARVCLRRLSSLASEPLTRILATGTPDQRRQTNVYTMMRHYDLVRALMVEEIARRYELLDYAFSRVDLNAFMTRYQVEHEAAAGWKDSTCKRIKGTLAGILHEGGYISEPLRGQKSCTLNRIMVDPDVEQGIRDNGDAAWLAAFGVMGA